MKDKILNNHINIHIIKTIDIAMCQRFFFLIAYVLFFGKLQSQIGCVVISIQGYV